MGSKDITTFQFRFSLQYSKSIENLLYNTNTSEYSNVEHVIQHKSEDAAVCLLCLKFFTFPISSHDLAQHFKSKEHNNNSMQIEFELYHKIFLDMKENSQYKQIYFMPSDNEHLECIVCDVKVHLDDIRNHCTTEKHKNNLHIMHDKFFNFRDNIFEIGNQVELLDLNYLEFTASTINVSILVQVIAARQISPLIFMKLKHCNVCYICKMTLSDEQLMKHVNVKQHLKTNRQTLYQLLTYHTFWMNHMDIQHFHKQFRIDKKQVVCLYCNMHIKYRGIRTHIEDFPCAVIEKSDIFYDDRFEDVNQVIAPIFDFPMTYADEVKVMYPEAIMSEVQKIDGVPACTIQRHIEGSYCLICATSLQDAVTLQPILKHVSGKYHMTVARQVKVWRTLAAYHRFWINQNISVQLKQYKFRPKTLLRMKCIVCERSIEYTKALEHIIRPCTQKIGKIPQKRIGDEESEDDEFSSFEDVDYDEVVDEILEDLQNESLSPKKKNLNENSTPKLESVIYEASTSTPSATLLDSTSPISKKKYTDIVKNLLYPPRIRRISNMYGNNADYYYLQKVSKGAACCLVCDKVVVGLLEPHLNSKKHIRNINEQTVIDAIIAYHTYWLSQPEELQQNQVYFSPNSNTSLICRNVKCTKCVLFKDIFNHNACKILEKEKPLAFKSELKKTYCSKVEKTLYPKGLKHLVMQYIDINIAQCRAGRIVCLICNSHMLRNYEQLAIHMESTKHIENMNDKHIQTVLAYHQYWLEQPPEKQINQILYVTHDLKTLKCFQCKKIVNFVEVDSHLNTCKLRNNELKKVIGKLDNLNINDRERSSSAGSASSSSVRLMPERNEFATSQSNPVNVSPKKENQIQLPLNNITRDTRNSRNSNADSLENVPSNVKSTIASDINKKPPNATKTYTNMGEMAHDVNPSIQDKNSQDVLRLLPNRYKNHLKYIIKFDDKLKCALCDIFFLQNITNVIFHIISYAHLNMSKLTPIKYTYYCEICGKHFRKEDIWLQHLFDPKTHLKKVAMLGKSRIKNLMEYECNPCNMVFYGDTFSVVRHEGSFPYKIEKKVTRNGGIILSDGVKRLLQNHDIIEQKAIEFEKEATTILKSDSKTIGICLDAIERYVSSIYPNCEAFAFGSRVAGAGTKLSDLDIFLDVGNMYYGLQSQESLEQQVILNKVKKRLTAEKTVFTHISAVSGARTPILTFVHNETNMDCDLSFRHGLSVENTKYVKSCFELQPKCRSAMLVLKKWASLVSLKEEMTSYAFCLMFFFQLQLQQYLLPIHKLRLLTTTKTPVIDGWDTIVYNLSVDELRKHVKIYTGEVYELVVDFFQFYAKFDFGSELVCPLMGRTILKDKFTQGQNGSALPDEMISYKKKLLEDPDSVFRSESAMCVQDPFDLSHNLTKAVPKHFVIKFQQLCDLTLNHILR